MIPNTKTRLLLADDHTMFREALEKILSEQHDIDIVATAGDGRQAVAKVREIEPDVAVLDLFMPVLNGLDASRQILEHQKNLGVILISDHHHCDNHMVEALRMGVRGYLKKEVALLELIQAVGVVASGGVYLSSGFTPRISEYLRKPARSRILTPREREVLQLVAEGSSSKQVASILGMSTKTAENHRARIMEKLNIHDVAGLTRYAMREGIIMP